MRHFAFLDAATNAANAATGGAAITSMVIWIVVMLILMYFMIFRPQKKQQKKQEELINSIEIGDSVLTTAGFYGVVIDAMDEVIIVEFGNNKNCRIPMQKRAVVEVEKPQKDTAKNA